MRIAIIRNGAVETTIVAPDNLADNKAFAEWAVPFLAGPFAGAEMRALRDDESYVGMGYVPNGAKWDPPVTPIAEKLAALDATTAAAMLSGYPYRGITLSTSPVAQTRWTALYAARDAVPYPLTVWSADDSESIEIKDAAEVAAIFLGMVVAMTAAHQAGAKAKAAIEVESAQVKR